MARAKVSGNAKIEERAAVRKGAEKGAKVKTQTKGSYHSSPVKTPKAGTMPRKDDA